jgi:6,7-dimethyl-8-ribityllumazine synthase
MVIEYVPGSFELVFGAKVLIERANVDSVIILGCVIQGETPHFTFVCNGVTQGITDLNIKYDIPVIFGLLTTDTFEQAKARAGGVHGNKGDEAAITALKMMALNKLTVDN